MPIIERVVGKKEKKGKRISYKTTAHMKNAIKYILGDGKTDDSLIGSVNLINKNNAFNEFVLNKMTYNKMPKSKLDTGKRMVVHFVQSFDPKDPNITPELAKKIADEFASSIYFKEYQVVYAVHTDAGHIHTHFIINTTNVTNGKAWQQTANDLEAMKQLSDKIALSYGISIINDRSKEKGKHAENAEYQAEKRGAGWKKEIFHICKTAKEASSSMEEFIKLLNENGVKVRLSESRKDITYMLNDKKINSDKLGFPKRGFTPFTKEALAKYFAEKVPKDYEVSENLYQDTVMEKYNYTGKETYNKNKPYGDYYVSINKNVDIEKNFEYYEKLLQGTQNKKIKAMCHYKMGSMLYYGIDDIEKNTKLAEEHLLSSISYGEHRYSLYLLSRLYEKGDFSTDIEGSNGNAEIDTDYIENNELKSDSVDKEKSYKYLKKAAEAGHEIAMAKMLKYYDNKNQIIETLNEIKDSEEYRVQHMISKVYAFNYDLFNGEKAISHLEASINLVNTKIQKMLVDIEKAQNNYELLIADDLAKEKDILKGKQNIEKLNRQLGWLKKFLEQTVEDKKMYYKTFGKMYLYGNKKVEPDMEKAKSFLLESLKLEEDKDILYSLYRIYGRNKAVDAEDKCQILTDEKKGFQYLNKAAMLEHEGAMVKIMDYLDTEEELKAIITKVENSENYFTQLQIAKHYLMKSQIRDVSKADEHFKKVLRCLSKQRDKIQEEIKKIQEVADSEVSKYSGEYLEKVIKNNLKKIETLKEREEKLNDFEEGMPGELARMYGSLGKEYYYGNENTVSDIKLAEKYLLKSLKYEENNDTLYFLAKIYMDGEYVPYNEAREKNYTKNGINKELGEMYLKKAADNGHEMAIVKMLEYTNSKEIMEEMILKISSSENYVIRYMLGKRYIFNNIIKDKQKGIEHVKGAIQLSEKMVDKLSKKLATMEKTKAEINITKDRENDIWVNDINKKIQDIEKKLTQLNGFKKDAYRLIEIAEKEYDIKSLYVDMLRDIERLLAGDETKNGHSVEGHSKGSMAKMFYKEESKKSKGIDR